MAARVRCLLFLVAGGAGACGGPSLLEGWDVTLTPVLDCTQTNLSVDCVDDAELAAITVQGRFLVSLSEQGLGIALTTHEGLTLPGWRFENDGRTADVEGCDGSGGECTFARRRTASVDENAGGCARAADHVFAGTTTDEVAGVLEGLYSQITTASEECGTSSIVQAAFVVTGRRVDEPVLAREQAP